MNSWRKAAVRVELRPHASRRSAISARNGGAALLKVAAFGLLTLVAACDRNAAQNVATRPQGMDNGLDAQSLSASGARRERLARLRSEKVEARAAEPQPKDVSFAIPPTDLRLWSQSAAAVEDEPPQRAASVFTPSMPSMNNRPSESLTKLVAFGSAPFPYDGLVPGGRAFLDVRDGDQRGHRSYTGRVLWENETFGDSRVLVHVPETFDPTKPAVMVVFFHGFGATLTRDVLRRQKVPAQVTASGANAVLVAPQFAVDARDGSAGRFWQHGAFTRFLGEAAHHLATLRGDPDSEAVFQKMPIVMVAYSGGFAPAAFCLRDIASTNRVKGVVLLDAAYGELETYAQWAAREHKTGGFFVSSYTLSTKGHNNDLKHMLASRGVPFNDDDSKVGRGVTFFDTGSDYTHESYVTQAWTEFPIKDVLARIPGVGPSDNVASQSPALRDRTAAR
ncbi:hypothetical protein [Methylocystis bryophila]|uniref:Alpha/beta hydrolase n=1 Tax=Methylocystis bryophila TaxID=655015 RepID=A0A1W6MYE0_9HYPH|nr:hypothetical protein [Methylocystis bryophila]ARN82595.1 hypothetical protein B1812_17560 [Methylocystis bryophila]BDV38807.1 hypothetical protein DSM21852_20600 [Methylocystis bryophila]